MQKRGPADFTNVDNAADPASCISYLDMAARAAAAYKTRILEIVDPRPGEWLLDIGCGTGDDARLLSERVAPGGHVIGVDQSRTMVEEAGRRAAGQTLSIEFRVGDAHHLDFADESFDGCRTERTLQHVTDPARALGEMVRVARPGARIVVAEPDWETAMIDASDRRVTRAFFNFRCDHRTRNGWVGRQLTGLFRQLGLEVSVIEPVTICISDFDTAAQAFSLEETAREASESGVVSPSEVESWLADLKQRAGGGRFFASLTAFIVRGEKP